MGAKMTKEETLHELEVIFRVLTVALYPLALWGSYYCVITAVVFGALIQIGEPPHFEQVLSLLSVCGTGLGVIWLFVCPIWFLWKRYWGRYGLLSLVVALIFNLPTVTIFFLFYF